MTTDLPEGWSVVEVGDVYDCWGGMTPSTSERRYWDGEVPWLSSKDVKTWRVSQGTEFVTQEALNDTRLRLCRPGTVLVVVRSGVLARTLPVAIATGEVVINQDLKALDSGDVAFNEWLGIYLRAYEREILEGDRKDGTTVQSIRVKELLRRQVRVPPLAEQRRIVAKVEELLAHVNAAKGRLENVRTVLKKFRQSVLAAACSGKLTEEWRQQHHGYGPSGDGSPPDWRRMTVRQIASREPRSIQSGPFGSNLRHSEFQQEGKLVIGIDNVGDGKFLAGKQHRISHAKFADLAKYRARPLDVLITVMATIGRSCVVPEDVEPAIITKHVYRVTVDRDVMLPHFLLMVFRGDPTVAEQVRAQVRGQTRPGINGRIVKELVVPVPPLEEQRIATRLADTLLDSADRIELQVATACDRAERIGQSVLCRAFSGLLVPTEAELARAEGRDYEPADVLLERIKKEREAGTPRARRRSKRSRKSPRGS